MGGTGGGGAVGGTGGGGAVDGTGGGGAVGGTGTPPPDYSSAEDIRRANNIR